MGAWIYATVKDTGVFFMAFNWYPQRETADYIAGIMNSHEHDKYSYHVLNWPECTREEFECAMKSANAASVQAANM